MATTVTRSKQSEKLTEADIEERLRAFEESVVNTQDVALQDVERSFGEIEGNLPDSIGGLSEEELMAESLNRAPLPPINLQDPKKIGGAGGFAAAIMAGLGDQGSLNRLTARVGKREDAVRQNALLRRKDERDTRNERDQTIARAMQILQQKQQMSQARDIAKQQARSNAIGQGLNEVRSMYQVEDQLRQRKAEMERIDVAKDRNRIAQADLDQRLEFEKSQFSRFAVSDVMGVFMPPEYGQEKIKQLEAGETTLEEILSDFDAAMTMSGIRNGIDIRPEDVAEARDLFIRAHEDMFKMAYQRGEDRRAAGPQAQLSLTDRMRLISPALGPAIAGGARTISGLVGGARDLLTMNEDQLFGTPAMQIRLETEKLTREKVEQAKRLDALTGAPQTSDAVAGAVGGSAARGQ